MFAFVAIMYAIAWFIEIILKITFWIFAGIIIAIVFIVRTIREANQERRINASQSQYSNRR